MQRGWRSQNPGLGVEPIRSAQQQIEKESRQDGGATRADVWQNEVRHRAAFLGAALLQMSWESRMQAIRVKTSRRTQLVDITEEVQRVVTALGVRVGTCLL